MIRRRLPANLLIILLATQGAAVPVAHKAVCTAAHHHHHAEPSPADEGSCVAPDHSGDPSLDGECLICQYLAQRALHAPPEPGELSLPFRSSLQLCRDDAPQNPHRLSQLARGPPVVGLI